MNIKNWFKSPEGPMDLEAEVFCNMTLMLASTNICSG